MAPAGFPTPATVTLPNTMHNGRPEFSPLGDLVPIQPEGKRGRQYLHPVASREENLPSIFTTGSQPEEKLAAIVCPR